VVETRFFTGKGVSVPRLLKTMSLDASLRILQEDRELVEAWAKNYKLTGGERWLPGEDRIRRYANEIVVRGLG